MRIPAICLAALLLLPGTRYSDHPELRRAMARHGLAHASVVYGTAGDAPRSFTIDAPASRSYPYYSLSKPITASAVLTLVHEGKIDLDESYAGATVRDLLRHSGGWDRAVASDPVVQRDGPRRCVDIAPPAKQYAPGTKSVYSNLGYCLLGKLIEERTGLRFRDAVARLVPPTGAMAFDDWLGPAGGWSGTAATYFAFASQPIDPAALERPRFAPTGPYYALGWRILADGTVSHFGIYSASYALVFKRGDRTLVALFDGRPSDPDAAREDILAAVRPLIDAPAGEIKPY